VVVLWFVGDERERDASLLMLKQQRIDVITIEDILSDYRDQRRRYHIDLENELHPTPLAHQRIAEFLLHRCTQ
jgi:hypothetical protein